MHLLQASLPSMIFLPFVLSKIEWTVIPHNAAVSLGQDLVLNCAARDTNNEAVTLSYDWKLNNQQVPAKTAIFTNHSLLIPRITTNDLGSYYCVAYPSGQTQNAVLSPAATVIEAYINNFFIHPQSVQTNENDIVTFECVSGESAPYPEIFWELNGKVFTEGKQFRTSYGDYDESGLRIQYSMKLQLTAQKKHEGTLRCITKNTVLKKVVHSRDATIAVTSIPGLPKIIVSPPAQVVVSAGQPLILDCVVTGFPKTRTVWQKDGLFIDGTATSYVHSNGSIIFVTVSLSDSGMYYCKGINSVGQVTSHRSNVTVTALELEFRQEPADAFIFAGQSLTLHCIPPISVPPAVVTWYKDYKPLVPRTGEHAVSVVNPAQGIWDLYFSSVQRGDEGKYFCVAYNSFSKPSSRTSKVASVTVAGAPTITTPPVDTRIVKGRLLRLVCQVSSAPTPTIQWKFDGKILQESNQVSFRDRNQELWITNVDKSHNGRYTCVAKNIYGQKAVDASVFVIVPPVTLQPIGKKVERAGNTALLKCDVSGDPTPSTQWFKDGNLLQGSSGILFLERALFIKNVTSSDEGNYSCKAHNEAGFTWANGSIVVQVPPSIVSAPKDSVVIIGHPVTLSCLMTGHPHPSLTWLFNGTAALPEEVSVSRSKEELRIYRVTWQHVGRYTCIASNVEGTVQVSASLKIKVPPINTQITGDTVVNVGNIFTLTCSFEGTPTPSVQWLHQGQIIQETLDGRVTFPRSDTLRVKFSANRDAGAYSCKTTNDIGTQTVTVQVYIIEPPRPPVLAAAIPVSKSSIDLSWLANPQKLKTDVTGYVISFKQRLDEKFTIFPGRLSPSLTSYEVEGLKPGTEYLFTVSAENGAGLGGPSNALSVTTFESGPSEPRNLRLVETSSRSITIAWEVPSEQNGKIRKYQIQYQPKNKEQEVKHLEIFNPKIPKQEFKISSLHPSTVYLIRVRAANIAQGLSLWGTFSSMLEGKTQIAAPSRGPSGVAVQARSPFMVMVSWDAIPAEDNNGPLTGYRLIYKYLNSSQELGNLIILSNQTSSEISGLSPWTWYSFVLKAENSAGVSPPSKEVIIQTQPAAPNGSPNQVLLVPMSHSVIAVSWQPVAVDKQRSILKGYKLEWRRIGQSQWQVRDISLASKHSFNISELQPWTLYEVHIAAFTDQINPGQGPYSDVKQARTLSAAPGPVQEITQNATVSSIYLRWLVPQEPNGVIQNYKVAYFAVKEGVASDTTMVTTDVTEITLSGLDPDTSYNISVKAVTIAGQGAPVQITVTTDQQIASTQPPPPPPPPPPPITTDSDEPTTADMVGDSGGDNSSHNLPVIVAGSLTGGIFLLFLLAIIIYRCLKKRKAGREKYMNAVSGVRIIRTGSGNYDMANADYTVNNNEDDIVTDMSSDEQRPRYGSFNSHDPFPQSTDNNMNESNPSPSTTSPESSGTRKKSGSWFGNLLNSNKSDPVFVVGIENPGYFEDGLAATLPRPQSATPMTAEEMYSKAGRNQRKNRMRSESAAAIAVLRNSSMAVSTNDTSLLIENEAVVVFNERTAV